MSYHNKTVGENYPCVTRETEKQNITNCRNNSQIQ